MIKPQFKVECVIRLEVEPKALDSVFKALEPETRSLKSGRVEVEIGKNRSHVVLSFKAKDFTAFRAALNSYLRWFSGVKRSLRVLESKRT